MAVFGVILVRIFLHSDWIRRVTPVSLRIQFECGEILTRIIPNTDTFYAVTMTYPTRVTGRTATLIDIILISSYDNKCTSVNITTSFSDHLPQFHIMGNSKSKTNMIKNPKAAVRDYKNFNSRSFQSHITKTTLNEDVELGFETFFKLFNRILDKHVPYNKIRKKWNRNMKTMNYKKHKTIN